MLANTLNTNEVRDASATEVEFTRLSTKDRSTEYAQISETPSCPHRLSIRHQEIGVGLKKRRRSSVMVDLTSISTVDNVTPVKTLAYNVLDAPVGAITTMAVPTKALAELGSFTFTLGTSTFLYDGTGNGATALLSGGL